MGRKRSRSVRMFPRAVLAMGICGLSLTSVAVAGPYTEAGIPAASSSIVEWATGATVVRGPQDIANPGGALATFGSSASAIGAPNGTDVVSLGDGGSATLTFTTPISDGPGADFAVFENSFLVGSNVFAELGYVEVSSNGTDFFRFPSVSLTQSATSIGGFGTIDPTNVFNLAGKHVANQGTPFDLANLAGVSALLDVNAVTHVRVVDVVGRITSVGSYTPSLDSLGNIINDPYATPFASSGFDLDAVGVINQVPEPATVGVLSMIGVLLLGRRRRKAVACATVIASSAFVASARALTDFEDLTYTDANTHEYSAPFVSGGASFNNDYDAGFDSWSGWSYSKVNNPSSPGFGNQWASFAGGAYSGDSYGVAYDWDFGPAYINLPTGQTPVSFRLTNTTYTALSMLDGDGFAKKFGGVDGTDPDYLRVIITGYADPNGTGTETGSTTFYLADYRGDDDYIVDSWELVDLSGFGPSTVSIGFQFESSDVGDFGINTPTYLAMDDLITVPEPATIGLGLMAAVGLLARRRE